MKPILIISFFLFTLNSSAQVLTNIYWTENTALPASEVIYYNAGKKLVWNDFKGAPVITGPVAAMTMSGFGYKAELKALGNTGNLNISVYCYFSKPKSWVKPDKKTQYILNHEQHHFDISYIAASIFFNKLKSSTITLANHKTVLPAIYKECLDIMNDMQDKYDGQTKNGQLKDMQEKWDQTLEEKLLAISK